MKTKLLLFNNHWRITKEETVQSGLLSRFIQRVYIKSCLRGLEEKRLFFVSRTPNEALVQMLEVLRNYNRCRVHNHLTGYYIRYESRLRTHSSADVQRRTLENDCLRIDNLFSKLRREYEAYR